MQYSTCIMWSCQGAGRQIMVIMRCRNVRRMQVHADLYETHQKQVHVATHAFGLGKPSCDNQYILQFLQGSLIENYSCIQTKSKIQYSLSDSWYWRIHNIFVLVSWDINTPADSLDSMSWASSSCCHSTLPHLLVCVVETHQHTSSYNTKTPDHRTNTPAHHTLWAVKQHILPPFLVSLPLYNYTKHPLDLVTEE